MRRQEPLEIGLIFSQRMIDDFAMWALPRGRGQIDDLTIVSQCVYQPASNGAQDSAPDSTQ